MSEKLLSGKCLKIYFGFGVTLFIITIMVYVLRVQLFADQYQNLLSDFGTYFSGVLIPILTFFSIIALITTLYYQSLQLKSQQEQFLEQRQIMDFQLLLSRFDNAHKEYEKIINEPFNYSKDINAISLHSLFYIEHRDLDVNETIATEAERMLDVLEHVTHEATTPYEIEESYGIYFLFIHQVRLSGLALVNIFQALSKNDAPLGASVLTSLEIVVGNTLEQLCAWKMISKEKYIELVNECNSATIKKLNKVGGGCTN